MKKIKKTIERQAMDFVMAFERNKKRNPKDVSKTKCGYDIRSKGRKIEVKGAAPLNQPFVNFNKYNIAAFKKENNLWLYIVCGLRNKKPKLIMLNKNKILKRKIVHSLWRINLHRSDLK